MSTVTERLPLINLPIGEQQLRTFGILEAQRGNAKVTLPLKAVAINARVADRVASVTVKQTFTNTYAEHLEAVYIFPLSGGCVVSDFEMHVGSRVIRGKVQERGQARQNYEQALEAGKRAALLEQERDDVFTMQVGNLPPGEEITVFVTYSERLPYFENGCTELRLPLVVGIRYMAGEELNRDAVGLGTEFDTTKVPDASRITPPRLAPGADTKIALSIAAEIMQVDASGNDSISELSCSQHATQMSIGDGALKVELAKSDERLNRDFVLRWRMTSKSVKSRLLVHKDNSGKSYAMLSIVPPKRDGFLGSPRDVVFVLDRSGSMQGTKMVSASRACSILLSTLGPQDRFAIQAFDNVFEWMAGGDDGFVQADEQGLEKGEKFLRGIMARGGTELDNALDNALTRIANRPLFKGRIPIVVLLTDGQVGNEAGVLKLVQQRLGDTRLFTVGIDTAVNTGLLKRVANLGGGTSTFVEPGTALEHALLAVGREIGDPVITDLQIEGDQASIVADSLAPSRVPDLFSGRAVTAFFAISGKGSIRLKGKWSDGKPFEEKVKAKELQLPALAQLWAKGRIADLEDSFRVVPTPAVRQQIIDIAVEHQLLTKFTGFVIVDDAEIVNKDGTVRTVVQPVENPDSWGAAGAMQPASFQSAPARPGSSGMDAHSFGAPLAVSGIGSAPASAPAPANLSLNAPVAGSQTAEDADWGSAPRQQREGLFKQKAAHAEGNVAGLAQKFGAQPPSAPPSCSNLADSSIAPTAPHEANQKKSLMRQQEPSDQSMRGGAAPSSPGESTGTFAKPLFKRIGDAISSRLGAEKTKDVQDNGDVPAKIVVLEAALTNAMDELKKGRLPDAGKLEAVRKDVLTYLSSVEAGTYLPLLQKFLRGAMVELVNSLEQKDVTATALQPLWERYLTTFAQARAEATTRLANGGTSSDGTGNFWESSV